MQDQLAQLSDDQLAAAGRAAADGVNTAALSVVAAAELCLVVLTT